MGAERIWSGAMILRRSLPILTSVLTLAIFSGVLPGCPKKDDSASKDEPRKKKDDEDKKDKKKKKGDDDDDDKGEDKKKKKKGDDDDDDKGEDKKKKKKGDDDDDDDKGGDKKGSGATASIEGQDIEFKYAKAVAGYSGLQLVLSNEKVGCSGSPSDDAWQITFDLPPGPGGKFFTGGKKGSGVPMYINSQRLKLKSPFVSPYLAVATVDAFKLEEGEHVKGTLDFDKKYQDYTSKKDFKYSGHISFDAVICKDWNNFKYLASQPDSVEDGPVKGKYATNAFEYKSALATVIHDSDNDVDYIDQIDFYPTDKVTCAMKYDQRDKDKFFLVRSIGGVGSKKPLNGAPQSGDALFSIPEIMPGSTSKKPMGSWKNFGGASRRAWIKFDKLSFGNGDKISGEVYADSVEAKPEQTGKIGGKFEATICKGF
jgi:hypothetical protein